MQLSICKILTSTGSSLYWKKRASLINRKCVTLAWQSKTTHCKTYVGKDFGSEYENFTVFTVFSWFWSTRFTHFQFYTSWVGNATPIMKRWKKASKCFCVKNVMAIPEELITCLFDGIVSFKMKEIIILIEFSIQKVYANYMPHRKIDRTFFFSVLLLNLLLPVVFFHNLYGNVFSYCS